MSHADERHAEAPPAFEANRQYEAELALGLALSGESREFFAKRRLQHLRRRLNRQNAGRSSLLDFGCGDGSTTPHFLEELAIHSMVGVDESAQLQAEAARVFGSERSRFCAPSEVAGEARFDLAHCNGVFHHIPLEERAKAARFVRERLRPGGHFAFFENNPWNPGTRWVMSRIPFDRDALPISAPEARGMLRAVGFEIVETSFLFLFPRAFSWLRPLEVCFEWAPLGAQYLVLARKPANGREGVPS